MSDRTRLAARRASIDAKGKAVSPGFINMLSWAVESLIADGRGMSDTYQGVTLEVFGEGDSMGPLTPQMKRLAVKRQGDIKYPIRWTTLGQYLEYLQKKGVTPNVASFVGATTVRVHELGEKDVDPTPAQLKRMRALVRQAMKEGALGVGSALIYSPATYAETPELTALVTEAGKCGGMYISHMRSEGNKLLEAIDELITISRDSERQPKSTISSRLDSRTGASSMPRSRRVEAARKAGQRITANMYTYTAGATGLDATMPPWVQSGGLEAWEKRLKDPGGPRAASQGDAHALQRLGEFAAAVRRPAERASGQLQEPEVEAADRQDPGRSREDARQEPRRDGDGPGSRGR